MNWTFRTIPTSLLILLAQIIFTRRTKQHKPESELNKQLISDKLTGNSVMLNKSNKDKISIFSTEIFFHLSVKRKLKENII